MNTMNVLLHIMYPLAVRWFIILFLRLSGNVRAYALPTIGYGTIYYTSFLRNFS